MVLGYIIGGEHEYRGGFLYGSEVKVADFSRRALLIHQLRVEWNYE